MHTSCLVSPLLARAMWLETGVTRAEHRGRLRGILGRHKARPVDHSASVLPLFTEPNAFIHSMEMSPFCQLANLPTVLSSYLLPTRPSSLDVLEGQARIAARSSGPRRHRRRKRNGRRCPESQGTCLDDTRARALSNHDASRTPSTASSSTRGTTTSSPCSRPRAMAPSTAPKCASRTPSCTEPSPPPSSPPLRERGLIDNGGLSSSTIHTQHDLPLPVGNVRIPSPPIGRAPLIDDTYIHIYIQTPREAVARLPRY